MSNGFKVFKELRDGSPQPAYAKLSEEEQAHEVQQAAFWATWTRAAVNRRFRASAWEREANRYGASRWNTQHPMTKDEIAALEACTTLPRC